MAIITQKELGERIKALRDDFGYSQEELAKSLKIGRPAITQIEAGARDINSTELAEIAKIFDISIDTLLDIKINIKEYKQDQG
ncbi:MAG: helix-turn-helix transcriptional regulator [Patescibacteria group bacterium]